jgi:prepilin-type N-terminal cleavage/methylation domain-containing protein
MKKSLVGKKQVGFTIVELLIVIVVIGILAAITIVAYNGIQERARMASAVAFESQLRNKYLIDSTGVWDFDECSGSTVKNTSETASSDTVLGTGGVTWLTDTPSGRGCAIRFNGTDTRIETQAKLGSQYYVKGAWVRISAASCGSYNIISQAGTGGAQAAFYVPSCRPNAGHNGSWGTVQSPTAINDNKWHYVAVEWANSTLKLYVDGSTVATATGVAVPTTPAGFVAIGSHGGGSFMNGDIDNPFVAAQ